MKLLTFLGLGRYQETEYTWMGQSKITRYAPVAASQFLNVEEILIFLTEEVEEKNYPDFLAELPPHIKITPIRIPIGKSEEELWGIFDAVAAQVIPGEEIAFDITHGLRSFPLIGLLVAAYLVSGFHVQLKALFYGAFDIRDQSVTPNRTPFFDLTQMLTLLEWANAADRFNRTGDSRYLAALVKKQQKNIAIMAKGDHEKLQEVGNLGNLAGALTSITNSLRLIRNVQTVEDTLGLSNYIDSAIPAMQRSTAAKPFSMLLTNIEDTYRGLGLETPLETRQLPQFLHKQRTLINWYAEREQWVQAITTAREWLVNWFMIHLGTFDLTSHSQRMRVETAINAEGKELITAKQSGQPFQSLFLRGISDIETALNLWNAITEPRNDIDHAGFRVNASKSEDLIKNINNIIDQINSLPIKEEF